MISKQYAYAALLGACVAFGDIIAGRVSNSGLGATHILVCCVLTAIIAVKTTKAAESKR